MRYSAISILICACLAVTAFADDDAGGVAATEIHLGVADVAPSGIATPVDGISSTGQPDAAALRAFADSGYVAVIDLRGPEEDRGLDDEQVIVESLGMDYISLPITGGDAISYESAQELDAILQRLEGPVLVHCGSGNRAGALLALRHSMQGAGDEEAIAYGKDAGLRGLEDVVKQRLSEKSED